MLEGTQGFVAGVLRRSARELMRGFLELGMPGKHMKIGEYELVRDCLKGFLDLRLRPEWISGNRPE